jgi:hypothetical protein
MWEFWWTKWNWDRLYHVSMVSTALYTDISFPHHRCYSTGVTSQTSTLEGKLGNGYVLIK